jgi:peptidoglycan/xylan/chitin deacetylase (PgdA/CDA1 family)
MAGTIYTLHGVAPAVDPARFADRNISHERKLGALFSRMETFVPLERAMSGEGAALTIDDATYASAAAARLARRYGHAVTLFVNPGQVETGQPYSFNMLGVLLDNVKRSSVTLDERKFPARSFQQRDVIRARLKAQLRIMLSEDERIRLIEKLAAEWCPAPLTMPRFLETLTVADLEALRDEGVAIQNHGWSHTCHASLSAMGSQSEIDRGREWIARRLGVDANIFAVPFGDVLPPEGVDCAAWLIVDHTRPLGRISESVWNRDTLQAQPDVGTMERVRRRAKRLIRRAKARFSSR